MSLSEQSVQPSHLSLATRALFYTRGVPLGPWIAGFRYRKLDIVMQSTVTYIYLIDHISSWTFFDDLSAGRWMIFSASGNDLRMPLSVVDDGYLRGNASGTGWESLTPAQVTQDITGGVNVRHFGATGDNVTNDSAAVQAAMDALHAAGGGIYYFPPGDYLLNNIA